MLQIRSFVIAAFALPLCLLFCFFTLPFFALCPFLLYFPSFSILLLRLMLHLLVGSGKTASTVVVTLWRRRRRRRRRLATVPSVVFSWNGLDGLW
ncbi:hypothetical protein B0H65DRAFT_239961 [Neurospora tetraspora]|uniref:Uncharacterized protein n=1 Tax=Neurospora tetraspora TaxID=94610 RepID=A0AAE0JDF0_9PEZI|nr:hypothetical protein B0H65DRAFT_239961 [Neurospora tetraspora]